MTPGFGREAWLTRAAAGVALLWASLAASQDAPVPTVHWAYASYFGTGWYEIGDQQSAFIASLAPKIRTGEIDWTRADGAKAIYSIRLPFSVGVTRLDFNDVPGILDLENFSTVSAGLRGDIDVPVTARFSVRPSVQLSYGTIIGESEYAWTYRGDVRGRYMLRTGDRGWALIGAAGVIGYDVNRGDDDSFTYASIGTEVAHPVRWFGAGDGQMLVYWHLLYTDFLDRMEVRGRSEQFEEITNYWQAGFAFGRRDRPIEWWFFRFDRLGLAYDISPSGKLRGLKFVFRSLYEP